MELTKLQKEWLDRVERGTGKGNWVALGWPDQELGLDEGAYLAWLEDQYEDYKLDCEYEGFTPDDFEVFAAEMKPYPEWREDQEAEAGTGEEEFSTMSCDLCGNHLAGSRHPATLIPLKDASDYTPILICQDCLMYGANGEVPDDDYLGWMK